MDVGSGVNVGIKNGLFDQAIASAYVQEDSGLGVFTIHTLLSSSVSPTSIEARAPSASPILVKFEGAVLCFVHDEDHWLIPFDTGTNSSVTNIHTVDSSIVEISSSPSRVGTALMNVTIPFFIE